jgi:phospholipase C
LVVAMQDQHSFDNYFGTRPGVDGIPGGVCEPARAGAAKPCVRPTPIDVANYAWAPLRATRRAQAVAVDGGRMDGFVRSQASRVSDGRTAMGYYRPTQVPTLSALADHSVLFDHWFSSVPGGSIANRLFAVTARTTDAQTSVPAAGWRGLPTIFDRLDAAHVSWRIYVQNYDPGLTIAAAGARQREGGQLARVPVLAMPRFVADPRLRGHVVDLSRYYRDLATGRLPAVSYVVSTSSTEHPPENPAVGQGLMHALVNALIASPEWAHAAFLLDYDSSGGWYDHVVPPTVGGARLGLRVPALLLSPYAVPGTVDHSAYDGSAAVLRFIENNWSLAPLSGRDRHAGDLAAAFRFARTPRPAALIAVPGSQTRVRQPASGILYAGYLTALLIAVAAVVLSGAGERRRRRGRYGGIHRRAGAASAP